MSKVLIWIGLSIVMMVLWIIGLMVGNAIFPSSLMDMDTNNGNTGVLWLFVASALNTWVVLRLIYHSYYAGWKLAAYVFLSVFGIQYFMAQIETLWFNDSLKLPVNGIWALVSGGAVAIFLFSLAATWITKKYSISGQAEKVNLPIKPSFTRIIFLAAIVWPLIYFLFGYLVAWQFKEVRILYTGSAHMDSFLSLMKDNVASGLYFFQIFRGILWVLIGLLILNMSRGSTTFKGVTLGLLFAVLGSSGLLLPNPIMPAMVRLAHGIETSTSDFLWGIIIAWYLGQPGSGKQSGVVQS